MRDLERSQRIDEGGGGDGGGDDGGGDDGGAGEPEGTHLFNRLLRLHHQFPVLTVLMDIALVAIAYFGAYLVRWDAEQLPAELAYFRQSLAFVIVLKLMGLAAAGAYAPRFRHYSLADVWGTIRANVLGILLAASVLLLVFSVGLSRGVLDRYRTCFLSLLGRREGEMVFGGDASRFRRPDRRCRIGLSGFARNGGTEASAGRGGRPCLWRPARTIQGVPVVRGRRRTRESRP